MKTNWTTCSPCSRRAGLTLIEVVAAIAILGSLLVGIVLAKSRHTRQIALSQRTDAAVRAADQLIAGWWADPLGIPIDKSGRLDAEPTLTWRTRVVENRPINQLAAQVVRVEIYEAAAGETATTAADPLVTVELVLPMPAPEEADDARGETGAARGGAR